MILQDITMHHENKKKLDARQLNTSGLARMIYSRSEKIYGKSWEEWTCKWWQWILSFPQDINPANDSSSEDMSLMQLDNQVIFLAGNFGGKTVRHHKISSEKPILLPVLNYTFCSTDEPDVHNDEDLKQRAKSDIDGAEKHAFIDGRELTDIDKYRVLSNGFDITYPAQNVFGIRPGLTRAVSDGYWLFLKPMNRGKHDMHVTGACSSGKTKVDVILHLDVV
jgi:hypothetical protein